MFAAANYLAKHEFGQAANKQINKTCHDCDKSVARSADPGPKYFATTRPLSDSFGAQHEIGHLRAELMQ